MTQKEIIQQEIERTLESLNGIKRAEANPFLFTRIKARMSKKAGGWERAFSFVSRPLVALAVLVIVMAINGWSFFGISSTTTTATYVADEMSLPEFESEYKLITSTDSYDYENANNE